MILVSCFVVLLPTKREGGRVGAAFSLLGSAPSFVVGLFVMLMVNQVVGYYWDPAVYVPPKWWPLPKIFEAEFVVALFCLLGSRCS